MRDRDATTPSTTTAARDWGTQRVEAFSDGVMAIAITLLVLEIRLPEGEDADLGHALAAIAPQYLAYAATFVLIGIMWANHHGLFRIVEQVDTGLLLLNTLLLGAISFLPFPTGVLASHWDEQSTPAVLLYTGTFTGIAALWTVLWHYVRLRGLLAASVAPPLVRRITGRYAIGLLVYAATMLLAPFHPGIALAALVGISVSFLFLSYR